MHVTLYGKRGNKWTDGVRDALLDKGIGHTLVEEFDWARDPVTMAKAPPYLDDDGRAFIPVMPTIYYKEFTQVWIYGYEECLKFVEEFDVSEVC